MCFMGSRFLPFMIAFLVGLMVTGFCTFVGYNFLDPEKAQLWHLVVLFLVASAIGIIAGILIWKLAKEWAVTVLAFWLGIMLVLMILKMAQVQNQNISLGGAAVGGICGAWLG